MRLPEHQRDSAELPRWKGLTLLTLVSLLTCGMVAGGERGGTVAVFLLGGTTIGDRV